MKQIYRLKIFKLLTILLIIFFYSCKDKKIIPEIVNDSVSVKIDSTKSINDSIKKKLTNLTLNQLLRLYKETEKLEKSNSKIFLQAINNEIIDGGEILVTEYVDYTKAFWESNTPLTKKYNLNEVKQMIKNAKTDGYIQFDFDYKKDTIFSDKPVAKHVFDNGKSCHPALIIMNIANDKDFKLLEITKGIKTIKGFPNVKDGDYLISILTYTNQNNIIKHYDIVEDPSINY